MVCDDIDNERCCDWDDGAVVTIGLVGAIWTEEEATVTGVSAAVQSIAQKHKQDFVVVVVVGIVSNDIL